MKDKTIKKLILIIEIVLLVEVVALLLVGNRFMAPDMVRGGVLGCVVFGSGGVVLYQTHIYRGQTVLIPLMIIGIAWIGSSFF